MRAVIIIGFLTGIGSVAALAYTTPFLVQERIHAETRVVPNGGRLEKFEIRGESDLLSSTPGVLGETQLYPSSATWYPERAPFAGDAQIYRLRNENSVVIGTAILRQEAESVEWILHLPARGTMVLKGAGTALAGTGEMQLGLREFASLNGVWDARLDEDGIWRFETIVARPDPASVSADEEDAV
ncbi:MAG: hypothetical protein AAFN07_00545 [Pseudomonadota bacterium]